VVNSVFKPLADVDLTQFTETTAIYSPHEVISRKEGKGAGSLPAMKI
jgi:hypothetical protein